MEAPGIPLYMGISGMGAVITAFSPLSTAIICSLLGSCKERGVNPREWLNDVISKLPYYLAPKSDRDLKELLPDVWRK